MRRLSHRCRAVDVGRGNRGGAISRARPQVAAVVHASHLHQPVHRLLDAVPVQVEDFRPVIIEPKVGTLGNLIGFRIELGTDASATARRRTKVEGKLRFD